MFLSFAVVAYTLQGWAISTALWAGSITAIITAAVLIAKTPLWSLFKWVGRRLVAQPLTTWFNMIVGTAVNDSVGPKLDEIKFQASVLEAKNDAQHADNKRTIQDLGMRFEGIIYNLQEASVLAEEAIDESARQHTSTQDRLTVIESELMGRQARLDLLIQLNEQGVSFAEAVRVVNEKGL